jgi:hypothetical protein
VVSIYFYIPKELDQRCKTLLSFLRLTSVTINYSNINLDYNFIISAKIVAVMRTNHTSFQAEMPLNGSLQ